MPKQLVVILGMHRSGTSLITKSIELLGYSLGENLMPAGKDNPTGFWEDLDFVGLNDELLSQNQTTWDSPLDSSIKAASLNDEFGKQAQALLAEKFQGVDKLVVKDPRMSILMDFWHEQFNIFGVEVRYLAVQRNPLDIAGSLKARNGLDAEQCLLLDYLYNRTMLQFLGAKPFVVSYPLFVANPKTQIARIARYLGEPISSEVLDHFVSEFVDPSLCHHGHHDADLVMNSQVFPELLSLSRLMLGLATDRRVSVEESLDKLPEALSVNSQLAALQVKRDFGTTRRLRLELVQSNKELDQAVADSQDKTGQLSDRKRHIELLKEEVTKFTGQLASANQMLEVRDKELEEKNKELEEKDKELKERGDQLASVRDELNAAQDTVDQQLNELTGLVDQVSELRRLEEEHREQILGYQTHMENFSRIHEDLLGSVSYRLGRAITYPVRKPLTAWLLPRLEANSSAQTILKFVRTCIAQPLSTLKLLSPKRIKNFYLLLTKRQDLVEQVVGNYQEVMTPKTAAENLSVHHFDEEELAQFDLGFKKVDQPLVSVIIPVYNQIDYTLKCLQSIHQHLPSVPIELVIADDCSTDETSSVLEKIKGIKVVRHSQNLGFLRSCNRAIDYCEGKYIFLLNNDITVRPGWLDTLVSVFEKHDDAGLVGAKLVYPDGSLQEAGGIIWKDASGWNFGKNQDPDLPEFNYLKEVDYVSGAAILFPRKLFEQLGKFDERYVPAYYEDTDLAFSVRNAGKKVYFQPRSEIVHFEGKSHGTDDQTGIKKHQLINQEKFREKWKSVLDADHFDSGDHLSIARERSQGKTTILVIDHYVPHFDKDAGSRSTYLYLKLLVESGCNVKFLGDNFFKHEPYTSALQEMGIEVLYGRTIELGWKQWLASNAPYLDVVYLMRPHIAGKYIDVVNALTPKPRTIYFGHDLHYLRLQRQNDLLNDKALVAEAEEWKKIEYEIFDKADLIYYPSQIEVDEILSNNAELPVKAIPLYAFDQFDSSPVDFDKRSGLLFIGGFNHPPNVDGLNWFLDDVFPGVLSSIPDIRLYIVGSQMPAEIKQRASDNVVVKGFLSDEELDELYKQVMLSVVPLRFGAGVKGKVLDALDRGVPIVTTDIGAEGIPGANELMKLSDEPEVMAQHIVSLYGDYTEMARMSQAGRVLVQKHFSSDAVLKIIAEDFLF
jgi:GT2 family glycosyltransferase/glycosyltransferase involved in cell wall biosynthesis